MPHISLAAEKVFILWGLPISNALITSWLVAIFLMVFSYVITRKLTLIPTSAQLIVESIIGGLYDFFKTITGKYINQFFPLIASLFIFIITANWAGLLPGVGTVGFFHEGGEFIPLLRGAISGKN